MFPQLARFTDLGLLLLRLMVGLVFITSGYSHLRDPESRSKSIEMSKGFTIFLGIAEIAGGLGVAVGVTHAVRRFRADRPYAGSDPEENLLVAHRILGRENLRLALRPDVHPDKSGDRLHRRWTVSAAEVG